MTSRWNGLTLFAVTAAMPLGAVMAQMPAGQAPTPAAKSPVLAGPAKADPKAPPATAPEAAVQEPLAPLPPPPPPIWQPEQARALLNYIYNIGREGLNPADY